MSHDPLMDEPFSYEETKEGKVRIFHQGRLAQTLKGREAQKLLNRLLSADPHQAQLILAKSTGQFRFGNERTGRNSPKS